MNVLVIIVWGMALVFGTIFTFQWGDFFGMNAPVLSEKDMIIFWGAMLLVLLYLIINRPAKLQLSPKGILLKIGIVPGVKFNRTFQELNHLEIYEKEDHISEVPANMDSLSTYQVKFYWKKGKMKRIRGMSEEDAQKIKNVVEVYLKKYG